MYEFEKHPKLTEFIQEMANTGKVPIEWSSFIETLNLALRKNNVSWQIELLLAFIEHIKKDNEFVETVNANDVEAFLKSQSLQLQQNSILRCCSHNSTTNYCNSDGSYSHKMCDDCGEVIWH